MLDGTVVFYDYKRGFGFVRPAGSKDRSENVYFARTVVPYGVHLNENDPVRYTVMTDFRGRQRVKQLDVITDTGMVFRGLKKVLGRPGDGPTQ
jgi:cold shock CspA family protein